MTNVIVNVESLDKYYGEAAAVDRLSFSVLQGEIFALLGPNGAGKTTTLECIEGVRRADSGKIQVMGLDPMRDSRKLMQTVGIQLQTQSLPSSMTPREALTFFARYRGLEPDTNTAERLGLGDLANKQYGTLSTGQQRRLSLALCIQHDPKLVILDEPTAGLDVETREELHQMIKEVRSRGTTVMVASHDMAEVEKLADRVVVMVQGKLAVSGSPREITAAGDSATRLTISTSSGKMAMERPALTAAECLDQDGEYVRYASTEPVKTLKGLISWIEKNDEAILDLRVERPTLEERFLEIIGGSRS